MPELTLISLHMTLLMNISLIQEYSKYSRIFLNVLNIDCSIIVIKQYFCCRIFKSVGLIYDLCLTGKNIVRIQMLIIWKTEASQLYLLTWQNSLASLILQKLHSGCPNLLTILCWEVYIRILRLCATRTWGPFASLQFFFLQKEGLLSSHT